MQIIPLPAFADNYLWLMHDHRHAVVVDPGDAQPVERYLAEHGLQLAAVLVTHHHADHIGGLAALAAPGLPVFGPAGEPIAQVNTPLREGDRLAIAALGLEFTVLEVPGHTRGHIAYLGHGALFCGDTLFSAGCGRIFDGSMAALHASLTRLAALPEDTRVYCTHEYTLANLRFAAAAEPDNPQRDAWRAHCEGLRARGEPTLPSTIGREKAINPFLRAGLPSVAASVDPTGGQSEFEVFAALREWKNRF